MTTAPSMTGPALLQEIEARVRRSTSDRVRGLLVEEINGRVVLSGRAPSVYTKQLALHAALELISSGEGFRDRIVVMM
jgi:hypothetical protein